MLFRLFDLAHEGSFPLFLKEMDFCNGTRGFVPAPALVPIFLARQFGSFQFLFDWVYGYFIFIPHHDMVRNSKPGTNDRFGNQTINDNMNQSCAFPQYS